jgi:hypothetical protein
VRLCGMIACLFLASLVVGGCGDDGGSRAKGDPPEITQTYPVPGATDVNLNTVVRVWFDEPLNEATIDSAAFHVVGARTHHLEYDSNEHMITLYLDTLLAPETAYQASVKSSIKTSSGEPMAADSTFGFVTGPLDCEHLEDYLEPNDDLASAAQIELDRVYPVLSSCGGSERYDYYKFVVEATAKVNVISQCVYLDTNQLDWFIRFWRGEDRELSWTSRAIAPGAEASYHYTCLPGTYYAEVRKYNEDDHLVAYELEVQALDPCEDDVYEDNDFIDEAAPVSVGTTADLRGCRGDRDFYSIYLYTDQTLTATATQTTEFWGNRRLRIYDPQGISRIDTTFNGQQEPATRSWTAEQDGTHYVKVRWWMDGVHYDLDIVITE